MNADRILYRARQFWHALGSAPSTEDLALAYGLLTPYQQAIFRRMGRSEQAHSLRVLQALAEQGEGDKDLMVAALLHDAGKSRFRLHLWERAAIVLVKVICPGCVQRWGTRTGSEEQAPRGWRRAFIIAEEHPGWGAEMAVEGGCSPLAVSLIHRHQEKLVAADGKQNSIEDRLLLKLQAADNES